MQSSYWKVADFDDICAENLVAGFMSQGVHGLDKLLGNEAARGDYRKGWRLKRS